MANWLDNWYMDERGRLASTDFRFDGFPQAVRFVNLVAHEAEAQGHHPEMLINYDKVTVYLTTHDEGMVTVKDYRLGEAISRIYQDMAR